MPNASLSGIEFTIKGSSDSASASVRKLTQDIDRLKKALSSNKSVSEFANALKKISSISAKGLSAGFKGLGKLATQPFKQAIPTLKTYASKLSGIIGGFKRIVMYRAIRSIIREITQAFQEGIKNLYQWSALTNGKFKQSMDSISTSMTYFKNSLGAAVAPIINSLAPAIDWLIDKIVALINVLNQLFAKLSGASSWTRAVKKAQEYEEAVGGAGGAAKEALRYLAPFDELNRLPSENKGGGGGGGANEASGMFEEVFEFSEKISEFAENVRTAFLNSDWQGLGTLIGNKVNELVEGIDWAGIGQKVGFWINAWFTTKYWTLDTINFTNIGAKIAEALNAALVEIDFEIIGRSMVQKFTKFFDTVIGFIETADWGLIAQSVGNTISGFFNEIGDWFTETDFASLAQSIWKGVKDAVTSVQWDEVASSIFRAIGAALGAAASFIAQLGKDIWTDIKTAISSAITDNNGDGEISGMEILDGILQGIINGMKDIGTWVKNNIWTPFVNGIKNAFGIHSPATTMQPFGEDIGRGLLEGIKNIFTGIGQWCDTHILQPIREAIGKFDLSSFVFGDGANSITIEATIQKVGDWSQDVVNVLQTKTETVKKTAQALVAKGSQWVSDAWTVVKQKTETAKKTVQSLVTKGKTWVADAWTATKLKTGSVARTVTSTVKKGTTFISQAYNAAMAKAGTIKKTLQQVVTKGAWDSTAWTAANKVATKVTSTLTTILKKGSTWSNEAYNAITKSGSTTNAYVNATLQNPQWKYGQVPWVDVKANFTSASYSGGAITVPGNVKVNMVAASGGALYGGLWHSIPQYAGGTPKAHGSLFIAGEAGPEVVGHIGGRTEVLNRSQLASTMYAAVHSAIASTSSTNGGITEEGLYRVFLRALNDADNDIEIDLDGNVIYKSVVNRNRQNTRLTGVNALA